jgi:rhamnosyl/mannosyltransferase
LKILQIGKFYPPIHGGIESVTYEITEGLNHLNIQTDVLCSSVNLQTSFELTSKGYTITRAGSLGRILSTSISPAMILHMLKIRNEYDLIHLHMPNPMAAFAIWLTRPKAKLVTHWHSDIVHQKIALKFYAPLQNWILKRSDTIIATSEPYFLSSKALAPWKSKVAIIPLGITPQKNANIKEIFLKIQKKYLNKKIIFSLGRMTDYKGFDVLINAAKEVNDDIIILIGGSGDLLSKHCNQVVNEGVQEKIFFLGRISDEEAQAYLEASSVFCLPSNARSEAFGVVLLEAMAASKPVIATNIQGSGVPWVNQNGITGINVTPSDYLELAGAINKLSSNNELALKMGKSGKKRFELNFTSNKMIKQIIRVYKQLIDC